MVRLAALDLAVRPLQAQQAVVLAADGHGAVHVEHAVGRAVEGAVAHVELEDVFTKGVQPAAIDGLGGVAAVDEITAADVDAGDRVGGYRHVETIVPAEGHVVRPVEDGRGDELRVAGVVVRPQAVVGGRVVHVPKSAGRVAAEAPRVDAPLEGEVLRRGAERRQVLVGGEHHVAVVEDDPLRAADIDRVPAGG